MINIYGYSESMPRSVPDDCRDCLIRQWAEFFRGISSNGPVIAGLIHETLNPKPDRPKCAGAERFEMLVAGSMAVGTICHNPALHNGLLEAKLKVVLPEHDIPVPEVLVDEIAEQRSLKAAAPEIEAKA